MRVERVIGISYFEAVLHRRHKRVTLSSEIGDCFDYFEHEIPDIGQSKKLGTNKLVSIHGNGIILRKITKGKGYSIETDGVVMTVGADKISKPEQLEMVRKIRNITIPYAEHVKARNKKK